MLNIDVNMSRFGVIDGCVFALEAVLNQTAQKP